MAALFLRNPFGEGMITQKYTGTGDLGSRHKLEFTYVATGEKLSFPAFIDDFSDAYMSNWATSTPYGRMDPISTFSGTKRAISVSWNVPADSIDVAKENLTKLNTLLNFLYPTYDIADTQTGIGVINLGPYFRIKFGNWIQDAANPSRGLLGHVNGFTFDPDLELGMFIDKDGKYYPKSYRLNFEFKVLHEHSLGFSFSERVTKTLPRLSSKVGPSQQVVKTYTFNEPKINFGNFPYSTPQPASQTQEDQTVRPLCENDPNSPQCAVGAPPGSNAAFALNGNNGQRS